MKKAILSFSLIVTLCAVQVSCSEKDEIDCSKAETELENQVDLWTTLLEGPEGVNYDDGISPQECALLPEWEAELNAATDDVVASINKAKSCDFIKDTLDSEGYDSLDALIDELEAGTTVIIALFDELFVDC